MAVRLVPFARTDPNDVMFQLALRVPKSSALIKNITAILEKNAQGKAGQQTWLLHFGGLSLMQNTARVSPTVFNITGSKWPERSAAYDGWLVRLALRPYNLTYQDGFKNSSSPMFKEYSNMLCNVMDSMYAKSNFSQRYAGCKIEALRDKPLKVIFQLIFRQREDFVPAEIVSVLRGYRDPVTNVAPINKTYFHMDKMSFAYEPTKVPAADLCSPDNNGDDYVIPCKVGLVNEPVIKN